MTDGDEDLGAAAGSPAVAVECLGCGRRSTVERAGMPLVQLTRRLRCSECGSGAVKASRIETPRDVARLLRSRMGPGRP